MNSFVRVYLLEATYALDSRYVYFTLPEQREKLKLGSFVLVPFGNGNRRLLAVVVEFAESSEYKNTKAVIDVVDAPVEIDAFTIELCLFLKSRTFCTFGSALRAVLPRGLSVATEETYTALPAESAPDGLAGEVYAYLRDAGRETSRRELFARFGDESAAALHTLAAAGLAEKRVRIVRRQNEKNVKVVCPALDESALSEYLDGSRRAGSKKRLELLALLAEHGPLTQNELTERYGISAQVVAGAAGEGLVMLENRRIARLPYRDAGGEACEAPLTAQQQNALEFLFPLLDAHTPKAALLRGVTGSGKTRVIIECVRHTLQSGRSAIVLIPEIGLTAQAVSRYRAAFGDRLAVIHSMLSDGERADAYRAARAGDVGVVLGTRSAVFAPLQNLGLIAIDEEQEHTYKSENSPRYSAKEVAIWRGAKEGALVLLGSATPSVESMYRAKTGAYSLYTMAERYGGRKLPAVDIVDMREELKLGNDLSLSIPLREALSDNRDAGKQTILLLNRRGNSRALVCVDCRKAPECPRCSVRLTYHSANNRLMCHYCGFSQPVPERCPECGGPLKTIGTGTQRVQEELEFLFPDMETDRMDADTVSAVNTHEKILEHFQKENVPVLLGTQMVAKGLNLPNVTLVGVLDADLSLYTGGYLAGETTFNMLTQVVGRAGRGDSPGKAIIQTMVPDHQVIRYAAEQDYDGFYDLEIQLRRVQNAPPFGDLAAVVVTGREETAVLRGAAKFRDSLVACLRQEAYREERCAVLGPAPCAVPKVNYHFRYQLTLRCRLTRTMRQLLSYLLREFGKDKANRGVSAYIDVNGFD